MVRAAMVETEMVETMGCLVGRTSESFLGHGLDLFFFSTGYSTTTRPTTSTMATTTMAADTMIAQDFWIARRTTPGRMEGTCDCWTYGGRMGGKDCLGRVLRGARRPRLRNGDSNALAAERARFLLS
jgi:hypothetical protein